MKRPRQERPKTAFIYIRVSSRRQVDGTSLDRQLRESRAYCARKGWVVLEVFEERGAHAKSTLRPEFQRMLREATRLQGKLGHVVVYAVSRFARSSKDHHQVRQRLLDIGVGLRSVTELIDESPGGRMTEAMFAGHAEFDNQIRSDTSAYGMYDRAREGRWVWKAPLGYENVHRSLGGASLVQEADRAPLIRAGFDMLATGKHTKAETLRHVTALGLRKRNGKPLTPQDFAKLLENPLYAGRVVIPKWEIDAQGDFEPIASPVVFDAVQLLLKRKRPEERKHVLDNPEYPLRRFVRCEWCGELTTGSKSKGRSKKYSYYRCRNTKCKGDGGRQGIGSVPKERLESEFADLLRSLSPESGLGDLFREIVRDVWKRRHGEAQERRTKLRARVEELETKDRRLTEAFAVEGKIPESSYKALHGEYRSAVGEARSELDRFVRDDLDQEGAADLGAKLLDDPAELW